MPDGVIYLNKVIMVSSTSRALIVIWGIEQTRILMSLVARQNLSTITITSTNNNIFYNSIS